MHSTRGGYLFLLLWFSAASCAVSARTVDRANASESKCDRNNAASCVRLGERYARGDGMPQDDRRAAELFQSGCEFGIARGCGNLAGQYLRGRGVEKDDVRAAALFGRACDGGYAEACSNSGAMFEQGIGVARSPSKAVAAFRRACEAGHAAGCANLGVMYSRGAGVAKDDAKAAELFQRACAGGVAQYCPPGTARVWEDYSRWAVAGSVNAPGRPFAFSKCGAWLHASTDTLVQTCEDRNWLAGKSSEDVDRLFLAPVDSLPGRSFLAENLTAYFFPLPNDFWQEGAFPAVVAEVSKGNTSGVEVKPFLVGASEAPTPTTPFKIAYLVPLRPRDVRDWYASCLAPGGSVVASLGKSPQVVLDLDVAFAAHSFASIRPETDEWAGFVVVSSVSASMLKELGLPADSARKWIRYLWLIRSSDPAAHFVIAELWDGKVSFESMAAVLRSFPAGSLAGLAESIAPIPNPSSWRENVESWKAALEE